MLENIIRKLGGIKTNMEEYPEGPCDVCDADVILMDLAAWRRHVREHGRRRVESALKRLDGVAKTTGTWWDLL